MFGDNRPLGLVLYSYWVVLLRNTLKFEVVAQAMNMRGTAHLLLRLGDGGHVGELGLQGGLDLLQLLWIEGKQLCEL